MRTRVWRKLGLATMAASLVIAGDGSPGRAQTAEPLTRFQLRLTRKGEKPVIPSLGRDVWRMNADLDLPVSFDPDREPIQIQVTGPNDAIHVHPMLVPQLLPKSSRRWTIRQNVPDNGECTVLLLPKIIKWTLFVKCHGPNMLPPFPESTEFTAIVQIGDHVFTSEPADLRQQRVTTRRYP
jgi:hypothetical protein